MEWLGEPGVIVGISGILIGFIIAVTFYVKSKIVAKPQYSIENIKLIDLGSGTLPEDILMTYKGTPIKRLNKTIVRFWNAGKKTIDRDDIVTEHLKINFFNEDNGEDVKFFSTEVTRKSRNSITTDILYDKNRVLFSFNYLDYKNYFIIEIIHTGKEMNGSIEGDIKGVHEGLINQTDKLRKKIDSIFNSFIAVSVPLLGSVITFERKK